ncbi:hypothetical protein PVAP13_4NG215665 [Panicum virgatum]|uniref:At2g23090-like zinc-binding domain-containing protein n=1 Tax=Panicum virgatum TaxID=38727 RepID=A0A8T0T8Z9_PANVG|nr:hypothetical protein PVAP13_4NG215665 [Panicum virgatum]
MVIEGCAFNLVEVVPRLPLARPPHRAPPCRTCGSIPSSSRGQLKSICDSRRLRSRWLLADSSKVRIFICTTSEAKCKELAEARHPKNDLYQCFPHLKN